MVLSEEQMQNNKAEFINLLRSVNREGMENLIAWLETKSDFFTAPSSSAFHGCHDGGLCFHSLNVYKMLKILFEETKKIAVVPEHIEQLQNITNDNLIIIALLHDLCKTNFYNKTIKFFKDEKEQVGSQWKKYYGYEINDNFPLGHGEKSVIMAQNFIKLTATEIICIRWHMGSNDPGCYISPYERPAYGGAMDKCCLLSLVSCADMLASFIMEKKVDPKKENLIY